MSVCVSVCVACRQTIKETLKHSKNVSMSVCGRSLRRRVKKKKKKTPQKRESQATIYLPKVREFNMPQKYFNHKINIVLDFFRGDGSFD